MLNATLLAIAIQAPHSHEGCYHGLPTTYVERLVDEAWQKSDDVKIDEKRQKDLDRDVELGKEYSKQVDKELKASVDEAAIQRVQQIGSEMAAIANSFQPEVTWGDKRPAKFNYEFKLVQGKDVNAFSLPGGIIYVYEGLVKYTESDDELAGVLGHEISHAAFRHVWTLQRQSEKLSIGTLLAALAAIWSKSPDATNILRATQLGAQAIASGWSQDAERSSDFGGLQFMMKSRYDSTGSVTFMERLARDERASSSIDWGIYRTHPPSKERVQNLLGYMAKYHLPVRRSAVASSFRTIVKPGEDGMVEAWFNGKRLYTFAGSDAIKRADSAAKKLDSFFDQVPQMIEVTSGEGVVLFKHQTILQIAAEDAQAQKVSVQDLTEKATKAIKGSLFSLAYRVWGT
ncbi:MAG: M48 family metalloprotease [Chlorobia bacterium]|nr:M48 family metalloprotease [Fimbriimonadaceae bacterium]